MPSALQRHGRPTRGTTVPPTRRKDRKFMAGAGIGWRRGISRARPSTCCPRHSTRACPRRQCWDWRPSKARVGRSNRGRGSGRYSGRYCRSCRAGRCSPPDRGEILDHVVVAVPGSGNVWRFSVAVITDLSRSTHGHAARNTGPPPGRRADAADASCNFHAVIVREDRGIGEEQREKREGGDNPFRQRDHADQSTAIITLEDLITAAAAPPTAETEIPRITW